MDTGKELLISKLKGETSTPKMKDKINRSKKRIADSIEEGIAALRSKRKSFKYDPLIEELSEEEDFSHYTHNKRKKQPTYVPKSRVRRAKRNNKYESVFD